MARQPERTCIGCRGTFEKDQLVRLVAGESGVVIDYREKLPGRAVYVCPRPACIAKALKKEILSRSLKTAVKPPEEADFIARLADAVREKIRALVFMAAKAGKVRAGYSAVRDGLEKGRVEAIIWAEDISEGTREKIDPPAPSRRLFQTRLFTKDEWGAMLGRELVGVVGIEDRKFAEVLRAQDERLKGLINTLS